MGEAANLRNRLSEYSNVSDVCDDRHREQFKLSSQFLETMLFGGGAKKHVTGKGVEIWSACFDDKIDFQDRHVPWQLTLAHSTFERVVVLDGLRGERSILLPGARFWRT